jgi:hypothetical protein
VTFRGTESFVKAMNRSPEADALPLEPPVKAFAETVGQRYDLSIVGNQQQQVANAVIDGRAVSASLQVVFYRDSPPRREFPVEVRRELTNDLAAADFHAHASSIHRVYCDSQFNGTLQEQRRFWILGNLSTN